MRLTWYSLRSLWARRRTTVGVAVGLAFVAVIFGAVQLLLAGIQKTTLSAGKRNIALIIRAGSDSELTSFVRQTPDLGIVLSARGVAHDPSGMPIGAGELVVGMPFAAKSGGRTGNLTVRGLDDRALRLHDGVHIVRGRQANLLADEVMVGAGLSGRYRGLDLGDSFQIANNRALRVVGVFEDSGSSFESEVWAGLELLRTAFGRVGAFSSIRVRLDTERSVDLFRAALAESRELGGGAGLTVMSEYAYQEKQAKGLYSFVRLLGTLEAALLGLAAVLGATLTSATAVDMRRREIAVLKAIGFPNTSIVLAFSFEAAVLGGFGSALAALTLLSIGTVKVELADVVSGMQTVFTCRADQAVLCSAIGFASALGLASGVLPALRAARMPVISGLRH